MPAIQPGPFLVGRMKGKGLPYCCANPLALKSVLISPQISYMISAWARMCKILGKEFQQYLPVVMGPLMKTASIKPEVALLDSKYLRRNPVLGRSVSLSLSCAHALPFLYLASFSSRFLQPKTWRT